MAKERKLKYPLTVESHNKPKVIYLATRPKEINKLPQPVKDRLPGQIFNHRPKIYQDKISVLFFPYDCTKSRVKSYVVSINGDYVGIADRGYSEFYHFEGKPYHTLGALASALILGGH